MTNPHEIEHETHPVFPSFCRKFSDPSLSPTALAIVDGAYFAMDTLVGNVISDPSTFITAYQDTLEEQLRVEPIDADDIRSVRRVIATTLRVRNLGVYQQYQERIIGECLNASKLVLQRIRMKNPMMFHSSHILQGASEDERGSTFNRLQHFAVLEYGKGKGQALYAVSPGNGMYEDGWLHGFDDMAMMVHASSFAELVLNIQSIDPDKSRTYPTSY